MISSPEQLIHSLRTRHLHRSLATQQKCNTPLHTQFFNSKTDANKIDQNLSSYNTILILEKKQMLSESPIKLGLSTLSYRFQRRNSGWNSGEVLLIRRLLLKYPFSFLASPYFLTNEAGSRSAMLHPKQAISFLK
jgi:hypothetical protein